MEMEWIKKTITIRHFLSLSLFTLNFKKKKKKTRTCFSFCFLIYKFVFAKRRTQQQKKRLFFFSRRKCFVCFAIFSPFWPNTNEYRRCQALSIYWLSWVSLRKIDVVCHDDDDDAYVYTRWKSRSNGWKNSGDVTPYGDQPLLYLYGRVISWHTQTSRCVSRLPLNNL